MTLTLGQIFSKTLYVQQCIRRVLTRETRYCPNECRTFTESKISLQNIIRKNGYFYSFCSLWAKPLTLGQSWGISKQKSVKKGYRMRLSAALYLFWFRSYAPICRKTCWKSPNLTFADLWWPELWRDLKHDRISFVTFFYSLLNAAYTASRYMAQEPS